MTHLKKDIAEINEEIAELNHRIKTLKQIERNEAKGRRLFPQRLYSKKNINRPLSTEEKASLQNYRKIIAYSGMNVLTRKGKKDYMNLEERL